MPQHEGAERPESEQHSVPIMNRKQISCESPTAEGRPPWLRQRFSHPGRCLFRRHAIGGMIVVFAMSRAGRAGPQLSLILAWSGPGKKCCTL